MVLEKTLESDLDCKDIKPVSVLATQLCPTLCSPMDYSLPCSSVHGISQARILKWVAFSFLKEINPEYSLERLMLKLKLKLQYFGHLMQRTDSLEKTLMLGKIEGKEEGSRG